MRVPELYRAVPEALCYMHPRRCYKIWVKQGELAWVEADVGSKTRVETRGRNRPSRGLVFVPWFDEKVFIKQSLFRCNLSQSGQAHFKKMCC